MLGLNAHSKAIMGQWHRAKLLRDPGAVMQMGKEKGLTVIQSDSSGLTSFTVIGNGKCLLKGNLEDAADFVENYSVVAAL